MISSDGCAHPTVPHRLYAAVATRAHHPREYCLAPESVFNLEFEVEHVAPAVQGGTDELDNLALACRSCNLRKGSVVQAADPLTAEVVQLFHPRQHAWPEHFELHLPEARIEGRTTVGRATVYRLGMNRPHAVRARRLWILGMDL